MKTATKTTPYSTLALALHYPKRGLLQELQTAAQVVNRRVPSSLTNGLNKFLAAIASLSLSEWEELYTRTLDLNPPAAPYVGFQVWGENYQRGEFMSKLNRALYEADVPPGDELPDHLIPVLHYLECAAEPLPELVEILPKSVERMQRELRKSDPDNPYLHLLAAIEAAAKQAG